MLARLGCCSAWERSMGLINGLAQKRASPAGRRVVDAAAGALVN